MYFYVFNYKMYTNNSNRELVLSIINNSFTEEECWLMKKNKVTENIEKGIFNYTLERICTKHNIPRTWLDDRFKYMYLSKAYSIYANLNSNLYKNKLLKARMLKGEIKPHELVYMNPEEQFVESKM